MALDLQSQAGRQLALKGFLEDPGNLSRLLDILPPEEGERIARRLVRLALATAMRQPELVECSPRSVLLALVDSIRWGLDVDGIHAALVPFNDRRSGQKVATLLPMYQGVARMALASGKVASIIAHAVYERDAFEFEYGLADTLKHRPYLDGDRGKLRCVYAKAVMANGAPVFRVLTKADVELAKKSSRSAQNGNGPWVTHPAAMFEKTAIKKLCKLLPSTSLLEEALAVDDDDNERVFDVEGRWRETERGVPALPPPPPTAAEEMRAVAPRERVPVEVTPSQGANPPATGQAPMPGTSPGASLMPGMRWSVRSTAASQPSSESPSPRASRARTSAERSSPEAPKRQRSRKPKAETPTSGGGGDAPGPGASGTAPGPAQAPAVASVADADKARAMRAAKRLCLPVEVLRALDFGAPDDELSSNAVAHISSSIARDLGLGGRISEWTPVAKRWSAAGYMVRLDGGTPTRPARVREALAVLELSDTGQGAPTESVGGARLAPADERPPEPDEVPPEADEEGALFGGSADAREMDL